MSAESSPLGPVPFQANIELLRFFLAHRAEIVESIEGVLNAQRKPVQLPAGPVSLVPPF